MSTNRVRGLDEMNKFLDALPEKIRTNVLPGALLAGAQPVKDAAISICPVGPPSDEGRRLYGLHEGSLRDSIRAVLHIENGVVIARVIAGGKGRWGDVWYAHLIEFTGAVSHAIRSRIGKKLHFGGLFFRSANHPGMHAQPFLRPALDSQAGAAAIAAGEYVKKRLATKEGLDTSDVKISAEDQP
jgi:HK97 gp10 family phage protein